MNLFESNISSSIHYDHVEEVDTYLLPRDEDADNFFHVHADLVSYIYNKLYCVIEYIHNNKQKHNYLTIYLSNCHIHICMYICYIDEFILCSTIT
jgi:hypothetical protein